MSRERRIAYFSMEIGLDPRIPTYSGGLGVLAGDTIRSAADLEVPMIAITLVHRQGYFDQSLDDEGWQHESPVSWSVSEFLEEQGASAEVTIEGRPIRLRAWKYEVTGQTGYSVPVYFLDADLPENSDWDRRLTHELYGGDQHYRLCQEIVLGIGGVRMLRALGYKHLQRFHLNEGHASMLLLELLRVQLKKARRKRIRNEDIEAVRRHCVFTTHTPVPAGHDKFPLDHVQHVLGDHIAFTRPDVTAYEGTLNMTQLALNLCGYVNGVAKKHGEVSRLMFAEYDIDSITNGVHAATWTTPPFQALFDRHISGWREDNFSLRSALNLPKQEVWDAHMRVKRQLIDRVNQQAQAGMYDDVLTLGFARRAAAYKRADLLFQDLERLKHIAALAGSLQVIFAGKAHPNDQRGKELIRRIHEAAKALQPIVKIAYLPNYDMELGQLITAGVDVWLNNPEPPKEASGTSGMKAALNGVPSLSILDGWWIEGYIEGITGWRIGESQSADDNGPDRSVDASALYEKLRDGVIPLYCERRDEFITMMRRCIALNGSFFNTQRMMQEYVLKAYFR